MSDTHLDEARALVAALLPADDAADLADAGPDDDLRDLGLDSVRLIGLVDVLRSRGSDVDLVDLAVEPTLRTIAMTLATTLATARDATARPQEVTP